MPSVGKEMSISVSVKVPNLDGGEEDIEVNAILIQDKHNKNLYVADEVKLGAYVVKIIATK